MTEILYSNTVNVLLSREQVVRHWLKLEIEKNFTVHEKSYRIRLTDPTDFFFLYTKTIAEADYNLLKAEQQLSIDFHTFPSILIELINETTDSSPSKRIEVTCHTLRANLSIVEPRKIRNITELNLELLPADDSEQKVYLASSLKQLQTESAESNHRNETKIDQLQKQLSETTKRLEDINNELESLKIRGEGKTEEIRLEYEAKINEEKRKALRAEQDARVDFDAKKGALETAFDSERRRFELKISDLENVKEELSQKKIRAENTVREQKIRIDQLTHEQSRINHENQKTEKHKNELDKKAQSREEQLFTLKSELASKTLEINELKTNISRMSYQTRTAEDQQASKDEKLQQIQAHSHKLERDNEVLVADLAKANEIIGRKMDESKNLKDKYRRNSEIIKKQEKLLTDKDSDIKKLATKLRQDGEVKQKLEAKQAETSGELETVREKLQAAINKNSQDDKVIQYLNKQLNAQKPSDSSTNPYAQQIASQRAHTTQSAHSIAPSLAGDFSVGNLLSKLQSTPILSEVNGLPPFRPSPVSSQLCLPKPGENNSRTTTASSIDPKYFTPSSGSSKASPRESAPISAYFASTKSSKS